MFPRIPYLDAVGLAGASRRGEEDYANAPKECKAKCGRTGFSHQRADCVIQCSETSEIGRRLRALCNDLGWLPF